MTAQNDEVTDPLKVRKIAFSGTGLTTGQRLTITESRSASVVADHYIENAIENAELWLSEPAWLGGLKITAFPGSGGQVTVTLG